MNGNKGVFSLRTIHFAKLRNAHQLIFMSDLFTSTFKELNLSLNTFFPDPFNSPFLYKFQKYSLNFLFFIRKSLLTLTII